MSDIRARIESIQYKQYTKARETVTWTHWYLTVTKGDMVINTDDCRDFNNLLLSAEQRVIKYRNMINRGVTLRPWKELVEQASI